MGRSNKNNVNYRKILVIEEYQSLIDQLKIVTLL